MDWEQLQSGFGYYFSRDVEDGAYTISQRIAAEGT